MRLILSCLLFLNSLATFSADTLTVNVDAHRRQFVITLPANPTTGYQWTVKQYDKTLLQLTNSQYHAPDTNLIGAGGQMTFTFSRAKHVTYPKSTTLLFCYARGWESGSGMLKKVTVYFKSTRNSPRRPERSEGSPE